MPPQITNVTMVAQVIQLAMAPAFLLVAVGAMLQLFAGRLARVVDRARVLEADHPGTSGDEHDAIVAELRLIAKRLRIINRAITMGVCSAITVGLVIVLLFAAGLRNSDMGNAVAAGFILAMGFLITGLGWFLVEVRISARAMRIPERYLELDQPVR